MAKSVRLFSTTVLALLLLYLAVGVRATSDVEARRTPNESGGLRDGHAASAADVVRNTVEIPDGSGAAAIPLPADRVHSGASTVPPGVRTRGLLPDSDPTPNQSAAISWRWTQASTPAAPPARSRHAMVYDQVRGNTVLFGGRSAAGAALGDTWVWDGASWTQKFPMHQPPPRYFHAMAWDYRNQYLVLFGGSTGSRVLNDTWVWDGYDWIQKSPYSGPPARQAHAMAYDGLTAVKGVALYSGVNQELTTYFDDTWYWDGLAWTNRTVTSARYPARSNVTAGLTPSMHASAIGGWSPAGLVDGHWILAGGTWQKWTAGAPTNRDDSAACRDDDRGVTVLYGGQGSSVLADTWAFNGDFWTQLAPSGSPGARRYHAMTYDRQRRVSVLFGGLSASGAALGDTWTLGEGGGASGADLVVQQIAVTDASYTPVSQPLSAGQAVKFTFRIANAGTASTTASVLHVSTYLDGALFESGDVRLGSGPMPPGYGLNVKTDGSWIATPGTHRFDVVVDDTYLQPESNESNNSGSLQVSVTGSTGYPDLVVENITLLDVNKQPLGSAQAGQSVHFSARIANRGTGPTTAGSVHVTAYRDGVTYDSGTIPISLPAGSYQPISTEVLWQVTAGLHTFRLDVDDTNVQQESNEGNNSATYAFDVGGGVQVDSFTASPSTITVGQSTTLSWASTGGASAAIDNGVGAVATSGSKVVSPAQTTTYTLTVTGAGGSATRSVTVTVNPAAPTISSFTASPATITAGQSTTLSWASTGGTSATIDNGVGAVATTGTRVLSPTQTTTYTLNVTGAGGTATASVTANVNSALPQCLETGKLTICADSRTQVGNRHEFSGNVRINDIVYFNGNVVLANFVDGEGDLWAGAEVSTLHRGAKEVLLKSGGTFVLRGSTGTLQPYPGALVSWEARIAGVPYVDQGKALVFDGQTVTIEPKLKMGSNYITLAEARARVRYTRTDPKQLLDLQLLAGDVTPSIRVLDIHVTYDAATEVISGSVELGLPFCKDCQALDAGLQWKRDCGIDGFHFGSAVDLPLTPLLSVNSATFSMGNLCDARQFEIGLTGDLKILHLPPELVAVNDVGLTYRHPFQMQIHGGQLALLGYPLAEAGGELSFGSQHASVRLWGKTNLFEIFDGRVDLSLLGTPTGFFATGGGSMTVTVPDFPCGVFAIDCRGIRGLIRGVTGGLPARLAAGSTYFNVNSKPFSVPTVTVTTSTIVAGLELEVVVLRGFESNNGLLIGGNYQGGTYYGVLLPLDTRTTAAPATTMQFTLTQNERNAVFVAVGTNELPQVELTSPQGVRISSGNANSVPGIRYVTDAQDRVAIVVVQDAAAGVWQLSQLNAGDAATLRLLTQKRPLSIEWQTPSRSGSVLSGSVRIAGTGPVSVAILGRRRADDREFPIVTEPRLVSPDLAYRWDTGGLPEGEYELLCRARSDGNRMTESVLPSSEATTVKGPGFAAPTIRSVGWNQDESAAISWGTVPNAQSYTIRFRAAGSSNDEGLVSTTSTEAQVRGLDPGRAYAFRVAAIAESGQEGLPASAQLAARESCSVTFPAAAGRAAVVGEAVLFRSELVDACSRYWSLVWDFGDGTTDIGSGSEEMKHAYLVAGTYGWKVTASTSDRTLARSGTVRVDELAPSGGISDTRVLPVALDVQGATAHYTTELTIANPTDSSVTAILQFAPPRNKKVLAISVARGEQHTIPDLVAFLRENGAIADNDVAVGTVLVTLSGPDDVSRVAILARTTSQTAAPQPWGRAGLAYEAMRPALGSQGEAIVFGLRANDVDRSNLALFNVSAAGASVDVLLESGDGDRRSDRIAGIQLAPYGWTQLNDVLRQSGIRSGVARIRRVSGTGVVGAYGVVNDNATNDGSFIPAVSTAMLQSEILGSELAIPVVVETAAFESELVVANVSSQRQTVMLTYQESLAKGVAQGTVDLDVGPGEQKIIPGVVDFLRRQGLPLGRRGDASHAGTIVVRSSSGSVREILAGARTSAGSAAGGHFGLFAQAVYQGEEARAKASVFGLRSDESHRSNLAFANLGNAPLKLSVAFVDGDTNGTRVGAPTLVDLPPQGWAQLSNPMAAAGVRNGWAEIEAIGSAPGARWLAYGVVNDGGEPGQRTGDGAYVPMVTTDRLCSSPARDTTPPVAEPPLFITVVETECEAGVGFSAPRSSPGLATFLARLYAKDSCAGAVPCRLDVTPSTRFRGGTSWLPYRCADGAGNVGTGSITVDVQLFGDLNDDGLVNQVDSRLFSSVLSGEERPGRPPVTASPSRLDMNGDGSVDEADRALVDARIAGSCRAK